MNNIDDDIPDLEDFSHELKRIRNNNTLIEKSAEIPINVIEDTKEKQAVSNNISKINSDTISSSEKKDEEFGSGLFKRGFLKKQNNQVNTQNSNKVNNEDNRVKDLTHIKANAELQPKQKIMEEFKNEIKNYTSNPQDKTNLLSDLVNKKDEWLTPDLLMKISQNPNLLKYFMDPRFSEVIGLMQKDPKKAVSQFGHVPEFNEFIKEFSKIMGTHFENLGNKNAEKQVQNQFANFDKETQEILQDPKIIPIISKLQVEGKLDIEEIQRDPYLSSKIKKLIDKGVFRVQRESELNQK